MSVKGYCIYMVNKIIHGYLWTWNFSSRVQLELNTQREIPYLRAPMYYSLFITRWNQNIARWMGNSLGRTWPAVTHVVSADETTMAATVEEVCYEVNSLFYFREKIIDQFFSILVRHSFVNQNGKPWFCEILRDSYRDGCQCLRTSVDYLIFLITLQVCKFLDGTSASPTALR